MAPSQCVNALRSIITAAMTSLLTTIHYPLLHQGFILIALHCTASHCTTTCFLQIHRECANNGAVAVRQRPTHHQHTGAPASLLATFHYPLASPKLWSQCFALHCIALRLFSCRFIVIGQTMARSQCVNALRTIITASADIMSHASS